MKGERFFFWIAIQHQLKSRNRFGKKEKVKSFFGKYVREQNFRLNPSIGIES